MERRIYDDLMMFLGCSENVPEDALKIFSGCSGELLRPGGPSRSGGFDGSFGPDGSDITWWV